MVAGTGAVGAGFVGAGTVVGGVVVVVVVVCWAPAGLPATTSNVAVTATTVIAAATVRFHARRAEVRARVGTGMVSASARGARLLSAH